MAENKIAVIDEVYNTIKGMDKEFKLALPSNVPVEKFIRVVRTALQLQPDLLGAKRITLYAACMRCAQDGLIPDGKEAALVVYGAKKEDGGEVVYMPMVLGICKKARNSGDIKTLDALDVYEKDTYKNWVDETGPHFRFEPFRGGDRGKYLLTFSYAVTNSGGLFHEEISAEQMDKIEAAAKAEKTPWKGPFKGEMRRKSAIRRLAKYRLPSSADLESVTQADDALFKTPEGDREKPSSTEAPAKASRLGAIIEAQTVKDEPKPAAEQAKAESQVPI